MTSYYYEKDLSRKIEFKYEDHVTHWEETVMSHDILISPYTNDLYSASRENYDN